MRVAVLRQGRPLKLLTIINCHDVQLRDLFFLLSLSSYFLSLHTKEKKKTQGKRKDSQTTTWYLRKFHFPMELIHFIIIISIPIFNKIAHQKTLVSPRHRDTWQALERKAQYLAGLPLPWAGVRMLEGTLASVEPALMWRAEKDTRNTRTISCGMLTRCLAKHLS